MEIQVVFSVLVMLNGYSSGAYNLKESSSSWPREEENETLEPLIPFDRLNAADQVLRVNFILASRTLRSGHMFRVIVHLLDAPSPLEVQATLLRNGAKITQSSKLCHINQPEILSLKVPSFILPGTFKFRIEGHLDNMLGGAIFFNETYVHYSERSLTIIVQTDRPFYRQGQTVKFRALSISTDLKVFKEPMDIYILDPNERIVQKWLSLRTNLGIANLSYTLPNKVLPGTWIIRVSIQGQTEEQKYIVEEYYPTLFEVQVNTASFLLDTNEYITGYVQANYSDGGPVIGNLTLRVAVNDPCVKCNEDSSKYFTERFVPYFEGFHYFKIPFWELTKLASSLSGKQVTITALVGDRFLDKQMKGYSSTIIKTTDIQLDFLGPQPQIFKTSAPFKIYLSASYIDNSPIIKSHLKLGRVELLTTITYKTGLTQELNKRELKMLVSSPGVWEAEIDLKSELAVNKKMMNDVKSLNLEATYRQSNGKSASTELNIFSQVTPNDHQLTISTSTKTAMVGEFIVFHVRTNFYLLKFSYVIISKGIILSSGSEAISSSIRTFVVTVTANMVPKATIVVYHVSVDGDILADSLTFPVKSASKNTFNISLNNIKGKLNDTVEITVKGKPGSFVGVFAIPESLYYLPNNKTFIFSNFFRHLIDFESSKNNLLSHEWKAKETKDTYFVNFPAANFAPDPYNTFENSGLIVFTDANLTSFIGVCDERKGFLTCLTGKCYIKSQRCDGHIDCEDGSDETMCSFEESLDVPLWSLNRQNSLQNSFTTWLWSNVIIGPKGIASVNVSLPERAIHWMITAFSIGKNKAVSLLNGPIKFVGEKRFYMKLSTPTICKQGELLGLRATVFNNNPLELAATVNLASSRHYKFMKIGRPLDFPSARNLPKKEHEHRITIRPFSSVTVYIPIVSKTIGEVNVTVMAQSQIGKLSVCKTLSVEANGIAQHKHTSVLLDLSNRPYLIKYFDVNLTDCMTDQKVKDFVPNFSKALLTVFGGVVGPLFPTIPMDNCRTLEKSCGSAEQNIFNFAMNAYMLKYKLFLKQRDRDVEKEIFRYLNRAYAEQLTYQTPEGGFKRFLNDDLPSVWLTAVCVRMLNEIFVNEWSNYVHVDNDIINKALKWILRYQIRSGAFFENIEKSTINATQRLLEDKEYNQFIALTSHVALMLLTVKNLDEGLKENVKRSRNLAVNFLERSLFAVGNRTDPYELALVTYVLTLAKRPQAEKAFKILNMRSRDVGEGMIYWGKEAVPPPKYNIASNKPLLQARTPYKYDSSNIKTTAYALLVYVEKGVLLQEHIVNWLNFQRLSDSGWASTQDTLIAYQALLEYIKHQSLETTDISITVDTVASPGFEKILSIKNENLAQLQTIQLPGASGNVTLLIKGKGMAVAQLSVQFNVDLPQYQILPPASAFALTIKLRYSGRNASDITYNSCQRQILLDDGNTFSIAVLEIEIPTGYYIEQQDLDSYVKSNKIRKLKNALYQERKVIFYFENLGSGDTCITFTVHRWFPVANLTKFMAARIYDYSAPEKFNETIIQAKTLSALKICDVCGSYECSPCPIFDSASSVIKSVLFIVIASSFSLFLCNL